MILVHVLVRYLLFKDTGRGPDHHSYGTVLFKDTGGGGRKRGDTHRYSYEYTVSNAGTHTSRATVSNVRYTSTVHTLTYSCKVRYRKVQYTRYRTLDNSGELQRQRLTCKTPFGVPKPGGG